MPIARITKRGLTGIGFAVVLLWSCAIADRVITQRAYAERAEVLRGLEQLQRRQRPEPVSLPSPRTSHRLRVTAG